MNKVFTFVCYILCGLALSIWYQAKVNFIIVGLCTAVLCILEKLFLEKPLSKLPDLVKYIYLVLTALVILADFILTASMATKNGSLHLQE